MDIMQSPLGMEINNVFTNGVNGAMYYYRAEMVANGEILPIFKIISIDSLEDYEKNIAPVIMMKIIMGSGVYAYKVYPYQSNLQVNLYRTKIGETVTTADDNVPVETFTYRATISKPRAPILESNSKIQPSQFAMDVADVIEFDVQLQDFALEQLRMLITGGIYRNITVEDAIKNILTRESNAVDPQGNPVSIGVTMVESVNTVERDHIVIPHGTRLTDVPTFIQIKSGGVYNAGLSNYFMNNSWYVFPPYDNTRFDQEQQTLTVIRVPSLRMPGVQRTYIQDGNNLKIIATGDAKSKNDTEAQIYNQGNGLRFSDANKMMGGFTQVNDNTAVISRGANNSEFSGITRESELNNVVMSKSRITANPLAEYSRIARMNGSYLILTWENSNPSLLFPGMQVKILYLDTDEVKEEYAVLLKAHHYVQVVGQAVTASRHMTNSSLVLFIKDLA